MNVQEYISSGIIESYVLGLATPEERAEFENMCRQYPELVHARNDVELSLENAAMQNGIQPPASLRQQVMNAALQHEAKVIPLQQSISKPASNKFKYAAVACAILLAGSLIWNITQYTRNKKLQVSYDELTKAYDSSAYRLAELDDDMEMLRLNQNVKVAAMKGTPVSPNSFATVYWDTTSKDVYLVINNLPKPPSDKQYQLWALLDGKPIDMGMIDNDYFIGQKRLMLQMKNAKGAQAFAITLEKIGGNPTPQGEMFTLGNL